MKPKPVPNDNSRNVEGIVILSQKIQKILKELKNVLLNEALPNI